MAKRPAENLQSNSKKIRLTTVDDSFWDDDVDDDCFNEIASKILEQDEVDSTKCSQETTPFYLVMILSDQVFLLHRPKEIFEELKLKVTCLQQKCEAKEGEVTILRTQIQKLKSEMIEDQRELEFKNLEIANLKQKISDISKVNLNKTNQSESNKRPRIEDAPIKDIENNVLEELVLPLRSKFPIDLFENIEPEIHVVETRINQYGRNTIPYLHNQIAQEEFTIPPGPKITVIIDNKEVGLEYVYPDILKIIQCDIEEIDSKEMQPAINKILGVSIQLLEFFKQYLEMLEKSYRSEDIDQVDKTFVQSNFDSNMNCEIGVRAGKTVQFVAEVLPYSSYLVDYVIFSKMLKIDENSLRLMRNGQERNYLSLLNDIVKKIYYLKKTEVCYTFLNAVGTLLLNISKENLYGNVFSIFNSITGLLLFTKPQQFVNFLCQNQNLRNTLQIKKKSSPFYRRILQIQLFCGTIE
ncbi:hypothetical protein HHI36_010772 [Cryptolaemus montrouzieri]|uniref:Uncharacterized protein n=1 Tax=Cryptolaemus montrouzieri TaxID=559131 RepID=A0ABD2MJT0_9CUCU